MGVTQFYSNNYQAAYNMQQQQQQQQNQLKIKRSFKRRRFTENVLYLCMAAIMFVMTENFASTQAVPSVNTGYLRLYMDVDAPQVLHEQQMQQQFWHQRYIRDVSATLSTSLQQQQHQKESPKDSSLPQSSSTEVSLEQPQGQCLLDGEYVPETTVFCEKQVGCRAIQKTGHCCPDYKCDCQKDGKTYLNGDKLVDPETPCTVCYCQGGEILCSSVTCFHRDDCTPKYIPGVCCPEYDNCPVATSESSVNKTTSTTSKPFIHQAENNPKITIKEITKPIEIRITDDNKAIPIHQMLKPSTTTSTTTTTTNRATMTATSTPAPQLQSATPTIKTLTTTPTPQQDAIKSSTITTTTATKISTDNNHQPNFSGDSNQHKPGIANSKGGINTGDTLKLSASVAYPPPAGAGASASTSMASSFVPSDSSVEVEDPVPALSVFSTQGLPDDPSKVNIKREYFITTEGVGSGATIFDGYGSGEYPNSELIYSQSSQAHAFNTGLQQSSSELDPDTAGSDNIYHIILTTDGPRLTSTSENYLALKGLSTNEGSPFEDLSPSSTNPLDSNNNLNENPKAPRTEAPPKQDYYSKSTTESVIHQHLDDDDSAIPLESNPAYPSLPEDDFSLRDNNFQINESDDLPDEPRSIGNSQGTYEAFKGTNKHSDDHTYGSGSGSGGDMLVELIAMPSSSTEGSGDLMLQPSTENYRADVIQFMYSGEDSSEETRITNTTDFKVDNGSTTNDMKVIDTSLESAETRQQIEFDMGSGSGELKSAQQQKQREPTTAKPNNNLVDIDLNDEVDDASGNGPQDDPKQDAESLKLDETEGDSPTNPNKSPKNNILSIKIQPAQEKQFHDDLH